MARLKNVKKGKSETVSQQVHEDLREAFNVQTTLYENAVKENASREQQIRNLQSKYDHLENKHDRMKSRITRLENTLHSINVISDEENIVC